MSSAAQARANLENAQSSTGPTTPEGKEKVSLNAVQHGLTAAEFRLLHWESQKQFDRHVATIQNQFKPTEPQEERLVHIILQHDWLAQRALTLQDSILSKGTNSPADQRTLALYMRYHATNLRISRQAVRDLEALRKQKQTQHNGFVSQQRQQEAHEARIRLIKARQEAVEFKSKNPKNITIQLPNGAKITLAEIHEACTAAIFALNKEEPAETAKAA